MGETALDIVLWLDLAKVNQMDERTVREHPPGATILRLTKYVQPYGEGTPPEWPPVLDAIDRLVREARRLADQSAGCHYWVTGRAGLPAFFHLGYRLGQIAKITFVHQPQDVITPARFRLDPSLLTADAPRCFKPMPWPIPTSEASGPAALVVSSERSPPEAQIASAMADRRARAAGVVYAHSPAWFDEPAALAAKRELHEWVRATCDAHPNRSALAVFVRGPSALAFLVGAAINLRVCRDVQIFEYDGARYSLAYELPYPAVPERNKVVFVAASPDGLAKLALDDETREIQQEQGRLGADSLQFIHNPSARPHDIYRALEANQSGVLHISGHGSTGELVFQDDHGALRPLPTADLAETIRLVGRSVRLVVLSACHSESHAKALLEHVDCVVAMHGPILDDDARRFAVTLYGRLALGESVQQAFDHGLLAMRLHRAGRADVHVPRDVEVGEPAPQASGEPPQLHPRDPGCAHEVFLVRRQRSGGTVC